MKLHIGCGEKILKGFVNIDVRKFDGVDVVSDATTLNMFKNDSIELIYVCHVLEHFGRKKYMEVLTHWYNLLCDGGILRISVPDIEEVFNHYGENRDLKILRGFLWGGQTYPENYHYCGWDFVTLKEDLEKIGFKNIHRYDWKKTEHSDVDDFSQCFLPHMDKENGRLMSLNIECVKTNKII